jgi:hypothetical protein
MSGSASLRATAPATKVPASSSSGPLLLQRKCACGGGASGPSGDCDACKKKRLQRKLAVGSSHDPLEVEADRVADQVMARRAPGTTKEAPVRVQRMSGGGTGGVEGAAPPSVERVLATSGRALDPSLRADMEQRFGHDFSGVRVHHDAGAQASARDVSAKAYTVGHHIVFGAGSYSPRTDAGRRLLAHELAHTVQQGADGHRLQRAPAGGCAASWFDANTAGEEAHLQIQKHFALDREEQLPRATKDDKSEGCPKRGRAVGKVDLWRTDGGSKAEIGEIKAANDESEELGREEVVHYVRRYRQLVERLNGGDCYDSTMDAKDAEFVTKWFPDRLHRNVRLPKGAALSGVIPTAKTYVGQFNYDPKKFLWCSRNPGGVVVYWCRKTRGRDDEDEDDEKRPDKRPADSKSKRADKADSKPDNPYLDPLTVVTAVLVGGAAVAAKYASKPVPPKVTAPTTPAPQPPAKTPGPVATAKPQPTTVKPTAPTPKPTAPAPRAGSYKLNGPVRTGTTPRIRTPTPRLGTPRVPRMPRMPPPRISGGGGMRAPSGGGAGMGALGAVGLALSAYGAWKAYSGAKDQVDALAVPYNAYWDEVDKLLKQNRGSPSNNVGAAPPAPAPPPPPPAPAPAPPPEPPKKETKVHLFDATHNTFTEKDATVPSSSLNVTLFPVTFYSLTAPGVGTLSIDRSQVDCTRLGKGAAGISGIREYQGYATARDVEALKAIYAKQLTFARVSCIGKTPQPSTPDGDQVTATLLAEGDSVSATCTTLAGAQASCSSHGDFKAMAALIDDPDFPPDFFLEVMVARTRGGRTQESYATVTGTVDDLGFADATVDGGIPADVNGQTYATSSELAFLLDFYADMNPP